LLHGAGKTTAARKIVDYLCIFQFFPSCCTVWWEGLVLVAYSTAFNSFPVAAAAGEGGPERPQAQLFQFFPSCCHSVIATSNWTSEDELSILSQLLRGQAPQEGQADWKALSILSQLLLVQYYATFEPGLGAFLSILSQLLRIPWSS
jgi:hypothetical protein